MELLAIKLTFHINAPNILTCGWLSFARGWCRPARINFPELSSGQMKKANKQAK
jgi:hypothetical protein